MKAGIHFDGEKWKKKYELVMQREKAIDTSSAIPRGLTKQGEKVLQSNPRFWIVHLKLHMSRYSDETLLQVKDLLHKNFQGKDLDLIRLEFPDLIPPNENIDNNNVQGEGEPTAVLHDCTIINNNNNTTLEQVDASS